MATTPDAGTSNGSQAEEICLVCNDFSTGYHYGVPSCNGCKTFFRRTIMKKQVFVCQYNGNCPIDKSIRCACRYCRFEKCLKVGMDRNAIQQNRDPIGYTKRTRRYPLVKAASGSLGTSSSAHVPQSQSPQSVNELTAEQMAEDVLLQTLMQVENQVEKLRNSNFIMQKSLIDAVMAPSLFLDSSFIDSPIEPAHNYTRSSKLIPDTLRPAKMADYQYWHEREWVIMIEWAKTIPVYKDLELSDKLALLRYSAITYPAMIQCFYTPDKGPDTIVFPNGAYFDRNPEPERPAGFQRKKFQMLDNLLKPLRDMRVDINEFAAAKAIFFLNPDADDLHPDTRHPIAETRASITNALYRYMVKRRGSEEAADRYGKLLLLGTVIATMAVEMKEAVVVADFFEQVKFSQFSKELLFGIKNETDNSTPQPVSVVVSP